MRLYLMDKQDRILLLCRTNYGKPGSIPEADRNIARGYSGVARSVDRFDRRAPRSSLDRGWRRSGASGGNGGPDFSDGSGGDEPGKTGGGEEPPRGTDRDRWN